MSDKKFASQADLEEKKISFDKLSDHAYAYTAEGDPNTGIVIGDDAVMVIDTQATPVMAQDVEAGRPVEIDVLLSAVREIGQKVGERTPQLDALLGLSRLHARTHGLYPG